MERSDDWRFDDRTASYHSFLKSVNHKKNYEIVKTVANPDALKLLKHFNSISYEGLMRSYIHGFEKTMKEAKEKYDEFSQRHEVAGWDCIEVPRVHMHEVGEIDLKEFIENSHKNDAVIKNADFRNAEITAAEKLKDKNVCLFKVDKVFEPYPTPGSQLRQINDFFYQKVLETCDHNYDD